MFHFLHFIEHNLQNIVEHGGYLFLLVTTALEGIPVLGQFVPGNTIVIISGFLAKIHIMNIYTVLGIVFVGATIGDFAGFALGEKYGMKFLTKFGHYFFIKKEYIEKTALLLSENSIKAIMIGRFNPLTRALTPFVMGTTKMATAKFWVFNFITVMVWAIVSVGIGFIFGASYHAIAPIIGKYITLAVLMAIAIIGVYRFINKHFHIFAKYELITVVLNLTGLFIFFKTVQDTLADRAFMFRLDIFIENYFLREAVEPWISILHFITNLFGPITLICASVVLLGYFLYKKNYSYTLITFLSIGGGWLFTLILKGVVMRLRPENALIIHAGYSFPSHHAVMATIFAFLLVYFFVVKIKSIVVRELLMVFAVFCVILTAFSRVYLGVHWLSDVWGGIGLGLFWVTLVILVLKYIQIIARRARKASSISL